MAEDKKDGKKSSWRTRMKSPFRREPVKADSSEGRGQTTSTLSLPGPSKTPPIPVEPPKNAGSVQLPKAVKPEVSVLSTDPPVLAEATLGDPAPAELQPTVETSKPKGDYSTNKLLLWDEAYELSRLMTKPKAR
jgi:hypothetical protein